MDSQARPSALVDLVLDSRHGSLQPDHEVKITAQAKGFQPASRTLQLAEGKSEEITLVLDPK
jgi:hypothetical protein